MAAVGLGLNAVGVEGRVGDIPFFDWSARTKYEVGGRFAEQIIAVAQ